MLTAAQQLAYISNHRAETSSVKHSASNSPGAGFVYRNAPQSGGIGHGSGVGKHVYNNICGTNQQSSQPILKQIPEVEPEKTQIDNRRRFNNPNQLTLLTSSNISGLPIMTSFSPQNQANTAAIQHSGSGSLEKNSSDSPKQQAANIQGKRVFIESTTGGIINLTKQNKSSNARGILGASVAGTIPTGPNPN